MTTRSNRVKILFKDLRKGVELGPWLRNKSNYAMLRDMRVMYVLRANIDNSLIKFGIGGVQQGGTSAWGRLHQYVITYGETDEFDCKGVKLFLVVGNKFNPDVEQTNSAIFRKELFLKRELGGDTLPGRGTERVTTNLQKLYTMIMDDSNKTFEDIELERRTSERLKQAEITSEDQVMRVSDHYTAAKGKSKTVYLVHWSRPYTLTKKKRVDGKIVTTREEVYTTNEPYSKLLTYRDGKARADEYIKSKPKATFRN